MYSMNVNIDGKNVVRNLDQFLGNNKNTHPLLMPAGSVPSRKYSMVAHGECSEACSPVRELIRKGTFLQRKSEIS